MKPLHTICYISKADPGLTKAMINEIFQITETNNNACNISGILLHSLGNFFQVLEGEEDMLKTLYEDKIKNDTRHSNIYEVYNRSAVNPIFANYISQFKTITTHGQLEEIRNYLHSNRSESTSDKLSRLLQPFIIFE